MYACSSGIIALVYISFKNLPISFHCPCYVGTITMNPFLLYDIDAWELSDNEGRFLAIFKKRTKSQSYVRPYFFLFLFCIFTSLMCFCQYFIPPFFYFRGFDAFRFLSVVMRDLLHTMLSMCQVSMVFYFCRLL